jgi:hypothetical protein
MRQRANPPQGRAGATRPATRDSPSLSSQVGYAVRTINCRKGMHSAPCLALKPRPKRLNSVGMHKTCVTGLQTPSRFVCICPPTEGFFDRSSNAPRGNACLGAPAPGNPPPGQSGNGFHAGAWEPSTTATPDFSESGNGRSCDMRQIARFLVVRRQVVDHYDKLTKAVYLGNMIAERNGYAIAEDRPKNAPRP